MTGTATEPARDFLARRAEAHRGWRRHLHQWPETAFREQATAAFLAERLQAMGMAVETGIAGTGIVATLAGRGPGGAVGLRADMDALPIGDATGLPWRSRNEGVSHACGHDGHMTMLLAAAECLAATRDFEGTLRFIFQPAEEAEGGGRRMVEEGLFERWPVDAVFGLHNWPGLPLGAFAARPGPVMAAMDLFTITIEARGVHAALPHLGTDAIVAAGAMVSSLQSIVSRTVSALQSAVVSLTQIHGGNSLNALPGEVVLQGTVRTLSEETRAMVRRRLALIVEGVASAHEVRATLDFVPRYPVTVNAAAPTARAAAAAAALWGEGRVLRDYEPSMASEDFAFMLNAKAGCYAWLGSGTDTPLHSPDFDFNDAILPLGALWWVTLAQGWSRGGGGTVPRGSG
ncbi:MAG: amidohydrolase [Rhodobacteraceae bacterium]|nr:amidohydrolase [Paracoccaceae bacterium]